MILPVLFTAFVAAVSIDRATILSVVPEVHEQWLGTLDNIECIIEQTPFSWQMGREENTRIVKIHRPFCLIESRSRLTDASGSVHEWVGIEGENSKYAFVAEKKKQGAPLNVVFEGPAKGETFGNLERDAGRMLRAGLVMWWIPLPEVIRDKNFSIKRIETMSAGTVRVEFELKKAIRQCWIQEGWFELDPNRSWGVTRFEYHDRAGSHTIEGDVEYDGEFEGFPRVRKLRLGAFTCEITKLIKREIPEREFRLSYYGLKETYAPFPVTVAERVYSIALWTGGCMIALMAAAAIFFVARRIYA